MRIRAGAEPRDRPRRRTPPQRDPPHRWPAAHSPAARYPMGMTTEGGAGWEGEGWGRGGGSGTPFGKGRWGGSRTRLSAPIPVPSCGQRIRGIHMGVPPPLCFLKTSPDAGGRPPFLLPCFFGGKGAGAPQQNREMRGMSGNPNFFELLFFPGGGPEKAVELP